MIDIRSGGARMLSRFLMTVAEKYEGSAGDLDAGKPAWTLV
jgi:hypothetical protein